MSGDLLSRILFVEDEADIRTVATLALRNVGGFEVEVCQSGEDALQYLQTRGIDAPDLIILDVMMPRLDGPSTLKAIRKMVGFQTIPIVFMTAKVQVHEIEQYRQLGALDVLIKPFDPMTLADAVRQIWSRRHE